MPEAIFATIEPPSRLPTRGEGLLIEVQTEREEEYMCIFVHVCVRLSECACLPLPPSPTLPYKPQASVCRARSRATGESDAIRVSQALPFLEYELHRQLMLKLRVAGMNAVFSLRSQLQVRTLYSYVDRQMRRGREPTAHALSNKPTLRRVKLLLTPLSVFLSLGL